MFGPAGNAYVYFTYGNHWMLCVVTHPEDDAAAILVRAAYPLKGQEIMQQRRPKAKKDEDLLSGPGKLAAAFALDGSFNGLDLLTPNDRLELIPAEKPRPYRIGTRIGIATGKGELTPWRFVDAELGTWASRPHLTGPTIEAKAFPLF